MWVDVVINFKALQLSFQYIKKKAYGISNCMFMSAGKKDVDCLVTLNQGVKQTTTGKKIPHKWKNPQGYPETQDCSFSVD